MKPKVPIEQIRTTAYRVPTDLPESDGTLQWDHTDIICTRVSAAGQTGLGWTYAANAARGVIEGTLVPHIVGRSVFDIEAAWQAMVDAVRNDGRGGLCARAISAVDVALWDLKAKHLAIPLVDLIGSVRAAVPIYGSGGFTSYDDQTLAAQLGGWAESGIARVKMKVGREPGRDVHRVRVARKAIGDARELFVDANGAYSVKAALTFAAEVSECCQVTWFEEPVSSDDRCGLKLIRLRAPAGMDIAAGEYGATLDDFRLLLDGGAVDCLQADATRCGGITGFLKVAALAEAFHMPLSAHCAPELHGHLGCCVRGLRHIEYFHDHVRLAPLLFDGVLTPTRGELTPDRSRSGHGHTLKEEEAVEYAV